MKQFLILLLLILISKFCFSQTYSDVVYLKDGSVIKCEIIENHPLDSIKIKTQGGNTFVYQYEQIDKMTRENIQSNNSSESTNSTGKFVLNKKYKNITYNNQPIARMSHKQIKAILLAPNDPELNKMVSRLSGSNTAYWLLGPTGIVLMGAGAGLVSIPIVMTGFVLNMCSIPPLQTYKANLRRAAERYNKITK